MRLPVAISDLSPFTTMQGTDALLIQDDAKGPAYRSQLPHIHPSGVARPAAPCLPNGCPTQWPGRELNPRHADFQSAALPTELPGRYCTREKYRGPQCNSGWLAQEPLALWRAGKRHPATRKVRCCYCEGRFACLFVRRPDERDVEPTKSVFDHLNVCVCCLRFDSYLHRIPQPALGGRLSPACANL